VLAPCRFAPSGWKYVKKNLIQRHLNHPNKVNSVGYYSSISPERHQHRPSLNDDSSQKLSDLTRDYLS